MRLKRAKSEQSSRSHNLSISCGSLNGTRLCLPHFLTTSGPGKWHNEANSCSRMRELRLPLIKRIFLGDSSIWGSRASRIFFLFRVIAIDHRHVNHSTRIMPTSFSLLTDHISLVVRRCKGAPSEFTASDASPSWTIGSSRRPMSPP
jgi:hypothetical protein